MTNLYIAFAPLQGYTDCVYRRAHWECVGGVDEYYTPFVRMERGEIRRKDLRDTDPEVNRGIPTVPQVIARDGDEFARLCDALQEQGWNRIDLNMGCPFPMQVKSGRGSGLLQHPDCVKKIQKEMLCRPEVSFSVKMRTGQESLDEGIAVMPIVNEMPLLHITLHPRLGRQQYKGYPNQEAFVHFLEECKHPMVYNGDVSEIESWTDMVANSKIKGLMIGRGLLAQPWMLSNKEPDEGLKQMHAKVYQHAVTNLCGDSQILSRLHAFWEYLAINRKHKKAILKSSTLRQYDEAVAVTFRSPVSL